MWLWVYCKRFTSLSLVLVGSRLFTSLIKGYSVGLQDFREIFCTGDPGGLGAGHLTGVFKEVWCQTEERDAMHAIVESQLIAAEMNVQDDQDRKNVALFGCKPEKGDRDGLLPNIDQTPRKKEVKTASPIISLDKRCLSCCSNTGTVLAGFKIACLNYTPGPVEYHQVTAAALLASFGTRAFTRSP